MATDQQITVELMQLEVLGPYPDGGYVISAIPDSLGLAMQGGPGLCQAFTEFVVYLEDLADMLIEDEGRLGPGPQEQLNWLRTHGIVLQKEGTGAENEG